MPGNFVSWINPAQGTPPSQERPRHTEAIALCMQRLRRNPEDGDAWNRLGEIFLALKDFDEAEQSLWRALGHAPGHRRALGNLTGLYHRLASYRSTITVDGLPAAPTIGTCHSLQVNVRNTGGKPWRIDDPRGLHHEIGVVLQDAAGYDLKQIASVPLPESVHPAQDVDLTIPVSMIAPPGEYRIKVDLLLRHIAWFENLGSTPFIETISLTRERTPINSLMIELTNVCNFDCTFCPNDAMTR